MRVLWTTNIPLPEGCKAIGMPSSVKGGWMLSLAEALREVDSIDLGVLTVMPAAKKTKYQEKGITHYILPIKSYVELFKKPSKKIISLYEDVINDFRPDILHVHGVEYFYGLLANSHNNRHPIVVSLQGLTHICHRYYFGGLSMKEILDSCSLKELVYGRSLIHQWLMYHLRVKTELNILKKNSFFIGRTLWDKCHLQAINPDVKYYHCDELLRPEFYHQVWDIKKIRRHSIFVSTGYHPIKGLHWLFRAAAILKRQFPDLVINVCDVPLNMRHAGYGAYLKKLIRALDLSANVVPLGMLPAQEMVREFILAHVVAIPSFIENSCNSLQEAQLIGVPVVASYVGGTPSLVQDGKTALCFPACDEVLLAGQISRIFNDDTLACNLSQDSREVALRRNCKETIVQTMIGIYEDVQRRRE